MEGKVAVLGDINFVRPFSALGVDTYAVYEGDEQVRSLASEILEKKYAMVVVAETIAPTADEIFSTRQKQATPCVVIVPFTTESKGYATESLGMAMKLATGIDILKNK
jgi:vacuolar-type H+-ATPase subunit F/Vma7